MAIIKQYHKDTDTTYVYKSESYWDPELKQARSKRTCIGKIDPVTGQVVPTGKRGRKKTTPEKAVDNDEYSKVLASHETVQKENLMLSARIKELEKELSVASEQLRAHKDVARKISDLASVIR